MKIEDRNSESDEDEIEEHEDCTACVFTITIKKTKRKLLKGIKKELSSVF